MTLTGVRGAFRFNSTYRSDISPAARPAYLLARVGRGGNSQSMKSYDYEGNHPQGRSFSLGGDVLGMEDQFESASAGSLSGFTKTESSL
jgi:hypothetical protein